jgi:hypothetical protein
MRASILALSLLLGTVIRAILRACQNELRPWKCVRDTCRSDTGAPTLLRRFEAFALTLLAEVKDADAQILRRC